MRPNHRRVASRSQIREPLAKIICDKSRACLSGELAARPCSIRVLDASRRCLVIIRYQFDRCRSDATKAMGSWPTRLVQTHPFQRQSPNCGRSLLILLPFYGPWTTLALSPQNSRMLYIMRSKGSRGLLSPRSSSLYLNPPHFTSAIVN